MALARRWLPRRAWIFAAGTGTVLSLLVPLAAAIRTPLPFRRQTAASSWTTLPGPSSWVTRRMDTPTCTRVILESRHVLLGAPGGRADLPGWAEAELRDRAEDGVVVVEGTGVIVVDGRGWPFRALRASGVIEGGTVTALRGGVLAPAAIARSRAVPTIIPLRPIPAGLLGNAAIFAMAVLLASGAARGLRRAERFERGRCPDCGYRRLGRYDGACPECGAPAVCSA